MTRVMNYDPSLYVRCHRSGRSFESTPPVARAQKMTKFAEVVKESSQPAAKAPSEHVVAQITAPTIASTAIEVVAKKRYCAFCDPQIIGKQQIFENDSFHVLVDYKPLAPGHLLIVSKTCIIKAEEMNEQQNRDYLSARKKVCELFSKVLKTDQYIELSKAGADAGQTVKHFHSHMVPIQSSKWRMLGQLMVLAKIALPICCVRPLKPETLKAEVAKFKAALPA